MILIYILIAIPAAFVLYVIIKGVFSDEPLPAPASRRKHRSSDYTYIKPGSPRSKNRIMRRYDAKRRKRY